MGCKVFDQSYSKWFRGIVIIPSLLEICVLFSTISILNAFGGCLRLFIDISWDFMFGYSTIRILGLQFPKGFLVQINEKSMQKHKSTLQFPSPGSKDSADDGGGNPSRFFPGQNPVTDRLLKVLLVLSFNIDFFYQKRMRKENLWSLYNLMYNVFNCMK